MNTIIEPSEVVFFLGAGASVHAGVPDTFSFVKKYIEELHDPDKKKTIKKIAEVLENQSKQKVDIELLLETLTKLENRKTEPLLHFFNIDDKNFILKDYPEKTSLIKDLKDFIKTKAIVPEDKIDDFSPLLGFIEDYRPLDIISVNYDTCIEQFCNAYKLSYQDGFDVHWNPRTFEIEHTDIRLYKLHGSVMWYQSDRGGYIKLPVMEGKSQIELITGERAENLMLYPMQKWDYTEPVLELLVRIKLLLESPKCKFLIVIGYSFRDEYVRKLIWDIARKNRNLNVILIDLKAYSIYSERLKYYDSQKRIPSSLNERVVCLPYSFEMIFPAIKNYYLKNLKEGLSNEELQRHTVFKGEKPEWLTCLRSFVMAENIEKIKNLTTKTNVRTALQKDWRLSIELPLRVGINLFCNGQEEHAKAYLNEFEFILKDMLVNKIFVNAMQEPPYIRISFCYYESDETGKNYVDLIRFKELMGALDGIAIQATFMSSTNGRILPLTLLTLTNLKKYFEGFKEQMTFSDYVNLRKDQYPDLEAIEYWKYQREGLREQREMITSRIAEIEKNILADIFENRKVRE